MFFIGGISGKVKPVGSVENCRCPACSKNVALHITVKYTTPHIFFIPTFRLGVSYIATCPYCASVMELDGDKGKAVEKGRAHSINPGELHVVMNNYGSRCERCGAKRTEGQNFCSNCGERL